MASALAVGGLLGLVATPAGASTAQLVELESVCKPFLPGDPCPPPDTALVFQGGREANRVTLVTVVGGGIRISDRGAVIEPGRGCSRVDEHNVSCSQPDTQRVQSPVFVATGGGADRVSSAVGVDGPPGSGAQGVAIDGGPGNDVLLGGPGPDQLFGGSGADRLRGRGGDDELHDASLRDFLPTATQTFPVYPVVLVAPGRSRDSYDGGAGKDTVTYAGRFARLRIDLANTRPVAGARGEHDSIRQAENAIGGAADDQLAGNGKANILEGGKGDDLLVGRAGGDGLRGQAGRDVIRAGPGNDGINHESPTELTGGDRMSCGSGSDAVGTALPRDLLDDDCELISPGTAIQAKMNVGLRSLLPLRQRRPPLVLGGSLECFPQMVCQVRAELRVRGPASMRGAPPRGTLLGSQMFTASGTGEQQTVDLRLSADGLRLLRRHRALRVRVIIASQYSGAEPPGYVTLLRAP